MDDNQARRACSHQVLSSRCPAWHWPHWPLRWAGQEEAAKPDCQPRSPAATWLAFDSEEEHPSRLHECMTSGIGAAASCRCVPSPAHWQPSRLHLFFGIGYFDLLEQTTSAQGQACQTLQPRAHCLRLRQALMQLVLRAERQEVRREALLANIWASPMMLFIKAERVLGGRLPPFAAALHWTAGLPTERLGLVSRWSESESMLHELLGRAMWRFPHLEP